MNHTKSQRKAAGRQHTNTGHAASAQNKRKWYGVTISRLNEDGTLTSTTQTASTGRVHDERVYSRRGKDIT